jgi:uncharacterized iron-regulated membrane protein
MAVKTFKFFWVTHKWTGTILAVLVGLTACTGFLLLIKKKVDWIQPPTERGAEGELADFLRIQDVIAIALAQNHPAFQSFDDIERIDVRPDKRVHKIHSHHEYAELQIDAITGEVLSTDVRRSDWLESLHDGSFFGSFVHEWVMPIVPIALLFLIFSGIWLWIEPMVRRARRRKRRLRTAP